ncbi:hypothetical protein ABIC71_000920 [Herbaspirillum seropedicae]|uniref:phage head-tail joining protein n=1 Tax=Herbaspirillum seropedicae TaxID=964 RepID=UPI003392CB43
MAFDQTQLDALDAAIASGELTVKYNGKEITYRSINELVRARNIVGGELRPGQHRPGASIGIVEG